MSAPTSESRQSAALPVGLSGLAQVAGLAAVYFVAAKVSLLLAIPPGYATAVWPPSGIALAAVLLLGSRLWPGVWLGATLVNLTVQASLPAAVLMGTGNSLEAVVGALLIRRFIGLPRVFATGADVVRFVGFAFLCATVAASVALVPLALVHGLRGEGLFTNWWTWWLGDAAGIIIVTPLALSWRTSEVEAWTRRRIAELAACVGLLLAATFAIFGASDNTALPSPEMTFAILPFIIWAAFRFGQRELSAAIAVVCAMAVWFTVDGRGPFAQATVNTALLLLLTFVSTIVATGLVLNAAVRERRRVMSALADALREVQEQAITDPLTELYNRRFVQDHLARELLRAERRRTSVAVIMMDLDHFKRINDTLGHDAGDRVLMDAAALLRRHIRGTDIACRYGGEEFLLLLPDATPESAKRKAEEICAAVRKLRPVHRGQPLDVTASFGVALFPHHARQPDDLIRAADEALYEAKGAGRDQVRVSVAQPAGRAAA